MNQARPQSTDGTAAKSAGCRLLTAPGRGAIAVIEVWGPDVASSLEPLFRSASGRCLHTDQGSSIFYGTWIPSGEDLLILRPPDSPTPADRLEIHCHGGTAVTREIIDVLVEQGFQVQSAGDPDPASEKIASKQEYLVAATQAVTEKTARILLQQANLYHPWRQRLFAWCDDNRPAAIAELQRSRTWFEFGLHLVQRWSVVVVGPPNVGKSSLMNRLVGFDRAIVHATPGTTRDVVTHVTAVDGWPIKLNDTAGLRQTADEIESRGVELSRRMMLEADLLILVGQVGDLDRETGFADLETSALRNKPCIRVINKIDLRPPDANWEDDSIIPTSAVTGAGLNRLLASISSQLVPVSPPAGVRIPINDQQLAGIDRCLQRLEQDDEAKLAIDELDRRD